MRLHGTRSLRIAKAKGGYVVTYSDSHKETEVHSTIWKVEKAIEEYFREGLGGTTVAENLGEQLEELQRRNILAELSPPPPNPFKELSLRDAPSLDPSSEEVQIKLRSVKSKIDRLRAAAEETARARADDEPRIGIKARKRRVE